MNRLSYNVLTEPWIRVVRADGTQDELGILPCLEQAHELREVRDPSPIVEFGTYRLLVAFVLDAMVLAGCRPENPLDLACIIEKGHFDIDIIGQYINKCGDVFDLFHPEKPFLQNGQANGSLKSIFDFYPVFPSGFNVVHFAHQIEQNQIERPVEIARLLVTVSPFNVKVKTGQPRTLIGDPPIYALPIMNTIFETILINIPLPRSTFSISDEFANGPIWRTIPKDNQSSTTPAQSFTWPCRFIKIGLPDEKGYVNNIINDKGLKALSAWKDPSCAVLVGDSDKIRHLRFQESRPLWLDAGPLGFCSSGSLKRGKKEWVFVRPEVIENAFAAISRKELRIRFYAWRTEQAKVFEWIRAQWVVPSRLGQSTRLALLVQRELDLAVSIADRGLRLSIFALAPEFEREERKPFGKRKKKDKRAMGKLADRCERMYWLSLEPEFHPLVSSFASLAPDAPDNPELIRDAASTWREAIARVARQQLDTAAEDMDAYGNALERQVHSRNHLERYLKEVLS